MPTKIQILKYWADRLIQFNGKFWVDVLYENLCSNIEKTSVCFACGFEGSTERCHINPLQDGGSNDCYNIHLLCKPCHQESEYLTSTKYWKWFNFKNPTNSASQMARCELVKYYASCYENGDYDAIPSYLLKEMNNAAR